jgi:hypothetical protein
VRGLLLRPVDLIEIRHGLRADGSGNHPPTTENTRPAFGDGGPDNGRRMGDPWMGVFGKPWMTEQRSNGNVVFGLLTKV